MNYLSLLSDCWAYGASYLPLCGLPTWAAAFLPQLGGSEVIPLGSRRFRALQKLGEGGYAVVYLVSEMATAEHPHPDTELRALKKILVQSGEHLAAVQQEMLVHSAVQHHPNILPLLDYCCSESDDGGGAPAPALTPPAPPPPSGDLRSSEGDVAASRPGGLSLPVSLSIAAIGDVGGGGGALSSAHTAGLGGGGGPQPTGQVLSRMACFLFPVFRGGTLASELERLAARGEMLATADVLSVFTQLVRATAHIHAHGYAHRDMKPLNVLIATNPEHPASRKGQEQQAQQPWRPTAALAPKGRWAADGVDEEAGLALKAGETAGANAGARYRCVVMDFGSARARIVQVASRSQALQLQEDAEAHCSAPYRAPELFDVPSPPPSGGPSQPPLDLDLAACDVWALGASLFQLMYGEPPFARAMNASGGSLALAVLNCAIGWPRPPRPAYPPELHQLVTATMALEPEARPTAAQLTEMVEALARKHLPDPALHQAASCGVATSTKC